MDRRSMVVQILIIFLIFSVFSLLTFSFYVINQDKKATEHNAMESLQTIAAEKAHIVSLILKQIEKHTENLADWTEYFISKEESSQLGSTYEKNPQGILYRVVPSQTQRTSCSALFFPSTTHMEDRVIKHINATEKLDPVFVREAQGNTYIQWSYVATEEGILRIFPYSSIDVFGPTHMQMDDPFYVAANKENNPEKKTVWTAPYLDFMGTGWMITCSKPLYNQERMVGVACADVKLSTIRDEFLADFRLGETGFAFVLEKNGDVIYHPSFEPKGANKGQLYLKNILEDPAISPEYRKTLETILSGNTGVVDYFEQNGAKKHLIAYAPIEGKDWVLAVEIDQRDYMAISNLEKSSLNAFVLVMIACMALLAVFIYRQYSRPFNRLIQNAKNISEGKFEEVDTIYNYTEMESLSTAFNKMSRDIKNYTEDLIRKNNEISGILNSIGGLFMILDENMRILVVNQRGQEAFEAQNFYGKKCYEAVLGRTTMCPGCKLTQAIDKKTDCYCRVMIKDNIYENVYYPIIAENNQVTEIIVHSQKITSKVKMEKELSQKEKLSEIGKLSSAVAHELKNPLMVIKGASYLASAYSQAYKDRNLDESIQSIIQTTENAEKIIYNLLDFSGPSQDQMAEVDVSKIAEQVILILRRNCIQKDIKVETDFNPVPCIYCGDPEPFKHILLNLINNAIKAITEGGTILVKGQIVVGTPAILYLSVEDNGIGIEEDVQQKIFDPFFTTNTTEEGTGIGLWLTKNMIEKMQGTIAVESKVEKGTKFTITLPVKKK